MSGDDLAGPPHAERQRGVDRALLAEHASAKRIERVWDRLERSIEATTAPRLVAQQAVRRRRAFAQPATALALACGVALGVGADRWANPPRDRVAATAENAHDVASASVPQLFAAGQHARRYSLPGGTELELAPGSVLEPESDGEGALVLRLVHGEVTLGPGAGATRLRVGAATVTAADGRVAVRLDGDVALVRVLEGSAEIGEPTDAGFVTRRLAASERATITVLAPVAVRGPKDNEAPSHTTAMHPPTSSLAESEPAAAPAWALACARFDYASAIELLEQQPGGAAKALDAASVDHLLCIGSGGQLRNSPLVAVEALERVVEKYGDRPEAMTAANDLARIYGLQGNAERAERYEKLKADLSKGLLLSQDALCKKIEAEAQALAHRAVVRLAARYRSQYPDGACAEKVDELAAAASHALTAAASSTHDAGTAPSGERATDGVAAGSSGASEATAPRRGAAKDGAGKDGAAKDGAAKDGEPPRAREDDDASDGSSDGGASP